MAISFKKYIDIVSGIGAGSVVRLRELMLRLFTSNPLLPTGGTREFTSATQVADYFGVASPEYLRALFYFSWVSKNITRPSKISFSRWVSTAVAPRIFGARDPQSLSAWQGITDGAFIMTIGGVANTMSALTFAAATSLSDVATTIQTAVNAKTGAQWTGATVSYNATRGAFEFTGGSTGDAAISVAPPVTGTDITITGLLGWNADGVFSNGSDLETPTDAIIGSSGVSNNFGSFAFIDDLSELEHAEVAQWNASQNITFIYLIALRAYADRLDLYEAINGIAGVGVTFSPLASEYPELAPAMILAATDYDKVNAVQNYMYQQFNLTASVTTDVVSDTLDAFRFNYYGATQTAGQQIDFYQRGLLQGIATDPSDMNVYANEIWLKDNVGTELLTTFLTLGRVSANIEGKGFIMAAVQTAIDAAVNNGTISPGKTLTNVQKAYVSQITDNADAWRQIENIGYWVNVVIQPYAVDDRTEYKAVYVLVYSKDDAVRKVEGTHVLI